jgi:hypothetical protein
MLGKEARMEETMRRQARLLNKAREYRKELVGGHRKGTTTITFLCIAVISLGIAVITLVLQKGC